jgi:hypothetical protein
MRNQKTLDKGYDEKRIARTTETYKNGGIGYPDKDDGGRMWEFERSMNDRRTDTK